MFCIHITDSHPEIEALSSLITGTNGSHRCFQDGAIKFGRVEISVSDTKAQKLFYFPISFLEFCSVSEENLCVNPLFPILLALAAVHDPFIPSKLVPPE